MDEDLDELWEPSELKVSIHTAPIWHQTKATDPPGTTTRAIDFGPSGLSGIGPSIHEKF
ncbi:hypothetical protein AGABI1DRAFT_134327 [Agaricus bisporus var. burnettii JB137-S8]|uniref:Uncharacterized protein n=1 Tax=Agaricus bisporus var. burnettii (strain JB137-S8 / ATCC MYA-4627 / FGSC 10392) TaxID=597362 RepID=K5WEJ4_AGABU|nr:uncharacterized protein AGABI1DRAFT_134327 [Agaricus bisporus var. burnettii JB137-S8]EKM73656.1 hypothetical protein AGABI1DRAFT_134327 [Agaricus bisporus var. burnettii JB137-S8]